MTIAPLERPTDDLRQVLVVTTTDRHYRVQRKWLVFDGLATDTPMVMGTMDGTMVNGVAGRSVWRDLPIITEAEANT